MTNKIINQFNLRLIIPLFLSTMIFINSISAQEKLLIIAKIKDYQSQVTENSVNKMVSLTEMIPTIELDIRYATKNNFTGKQLYRFGEDAFLREPVAVALSRVQSALKEQGLGLKVFDAYRPYSATVKMWELIKDERYVANPAKGSGHNRGIAVDLTIIDLATKKESDMGTGFDNFTDTAHQDFRNLPATVLQNRKLLKEIMEKNNFKALDTEWWHFYYNSNHVFDVMDIDGRKLKKLQ
ncbi:MAG TPA: M15 family metallopeptidase [Chitinophagaceae bacterium]|jgi:D-alanyl-D-alanine dipeptidase